MKEFIINSDNPSFISGWFIDELICDGVIDFYNEENIFPVKQGMTSSQQIDFNIKQSYDKCFSHVTQDKRLVNYLDSLEKVVNYYTEKYHFSNETKPWGLTELVNIQCYPPNGGFKVYHFERNGKLSTINRHLVFMTYLNTVEDQGETEFFYQNLKVKPQKGLTLIWPADWTHTHRGVPSPTESKIIVTGWYGFK